MALSEENGGTGMVMPVAPAYGGGYGGGFGNGMGSDWGWIILLLLLAGGGWGNNFGGGMWGNDGLYPWLNNSNQINGGFRDAMINDNIIGIRTDLCNGFNQTQMATQDLKYTVASEACTTRTANAQNTQAILDKLCNLELAAKNDRIADLERQLTMANLAASQTAQTSRILADNAAQTVALEQYLNPVPVPAYVVQNPNCCNQNNCGCGCGNF